MTSTYTATIRHHSIVRARTIKINGTLETAKRVASREFGAGYLDHEIVIYLDDVEAAWPEIVAKRLIRNRHWH